MHYHFFPGFKTICGDYARLNFQPQFVSADYSLGNMVHSVKQFCTFNSANFPFITNVYAGVIVPEEFETLPVLFPAFLHAFRFPTTSGLPSCSTCASSPGLYYFEETPRVDKQLALDQNFSELCVSN